MSKQDPLLLLSDLMLFVVAVVWGTSYGVVKRALVFYPVLGLLTLRFGITFAMLSVTVGQSGVVALGSAAVALMFAPHQWQHVRSFTGHEPFWASVFYLVFACTLFAFFAQNFAIKRSSPTRVALLMGSEPAFGALFACLWLGEKISLTAWVGGGLIVVASMLATVRWRKTVSVGVPPASESSR